jgi:hypothetical protein
MFFGVARASKSNERATWFVLTLPALIVPKRSSQFPAKQSCQVSAAIFRRADWRHIRLGKPAKSRTLRAHYPT